MGGIAVNYCIRVMLYGMFCGVFGTALGGVIAVFIRKHTDRLMGFLLEFSAGLMVGVSVFNLIPNAMELTSVWIVLLGVLTGILLSMLLQSKLKFSGKKPLRGASSRSFQLMRTGIFVAIGIALHNFPEGLAIGVGFGASHAIGLSLLLTIMIHDVPEGIAMALPLREGGVSRWKAVGITVLSGIPTGLGAYIGAYLGYISENIIGVFLAIAAGTMLFISIGDLVPESKTIYKGRLPSLGNIMGLLCGFVISVLIV